MTRVRAPNCGARIPRIIVTQCPSAAGTIRRATQTKNLVPLSLIFEIAYQADRFCRLMILRRSVPAGPNSGGFFMALTFSTFAVRLPKFIQILITLFLR